MIDATPEWLKSFAIRTFGVNDKRALIVGMIVVILILAAVLGIASIRRPWIGLTGLWVLAAVGAVAAFKRPTGSVLSVVPSIVGAFAGSYALTWLLKAAQPSAVPGDHDGPLETPGELDRRRFLFASLTIGGAAVVAGGLGRFISSRRFGVAEAARDALTIPAPTDVAPPPPAGFDTPGLSLVHHAQRRLLPRGHRARGPAGRHGRLAPHDPRHGRSRDGADARRPDGARPHRAGHHADVRVEPDRRSLHRERAMGRALRSSRCWTRPASTRAPTRSCRGRSTASRWERRRPSPWTAATRCSRSR